jgi:hypothetical protein
MPEDVQQSAEEPHVRHERRDASMGAVVVFVAVLIGGAIVAHLVLYWMLGGMERRQRAEGARGPQLPPAARDDQAHFPAQLEVIREQYRSPPLQVADIHDMDAQRAAEDALLASYGWSDRAKGAVRIPIDAALRMIEDPEKAKAHGIIAKGMKVPK